MTTNTITTPVLDHPTDLNDLDLFELDIRVTTLETTQPFPQAGPTSTVTLTVNCVYNEPF